jgi:DNA gyrase subunit A
VKKYGDARRTELTNVEETKSKEEKEIELIPPEKCVVVMTEGGSLKRIPSTSFRAQRKGGKGVKTQEDITNAVIRTNTVDSLMIFTNKGKMYRLVVNNIPEGTNTSKGTPVRALIEMEADENVATIYSIYRDTDAKYVLFITKKALVKKTALSEYIGTKKSKGIGAINIKEGDALSAVALVKDEPLIILTKNGYAIKFKIDEVSATGRLTAGVKGINLGEDDEVVAALPVRHEEDDVAVFSEKGFGKRVPQKELTLQKRGGKGITVYKPALYGKVSAGQLVNDDDIVLLIGSKNSICVKGSEIPQMGRVAGGNVMLKGNSILSVSKV